MKTTFKNNVYYYSNERNIYKYLDGGNFLNCFNDEVVFFDTYVVTKKGACLYADIEYFLNENTQEKILHNNIISYDFANYLLGKYNGPKEFLKQFNLSKSDSKAIEEYIYKMIDFKLSAYKFRSFF